LVATFSVSPYLRPLPRGAFLGLSAGCCSDCATAAIPPKISPLKNVIRFGKKGKLRPKDFIYDDYYDCYLCPENQVLAYSTTNRDGYREYKSDPKICAICPLLSSCTESKKKQKVVTRHIWREYLEICEEIRHQKGSKELYQKHKETVERLFGTAKEYHNLRYTREVGKSKMKAKVGLTLACLNIKKLAKMMAGKPFYFSLKTILIKIPAYFENSSAEDIKRQTLKRCLSSI